MADRPTTVWIGAGGLLLAGCALGYLAGAIFTFLLVLGFLVSFFTLDPFLLVNAAMGILAMTTAFGILGLVLARAVWAQRRWARWPSIGYLAILGLTLAANAGAQSQDEGLWPVALVVGTTLAGLACLALLHPRTARWMRGTSEPL